MSFPIDKSKQEVIRIDSDATQTTDGVFTTYVKQLNKDVFIMHATLGLTPDPYTTDTVLPHPGEAFGVLMYSEQDPRISPAVSAHLCSGYFYPGDDHGTDHYMIVRNRGWLYFLVSTTVTNARYYANVTVVDLSTP